MRVLILAILAFLGAFILGHWMALEIMAGLMG